MGMSTNQANSSRTISWIGSFFKASRREELTTDYARLASNRSQRAGRNLYAAPHMGTASFSMPMAAFNSQLG
jgi:hypothetical protein